MAPGHALLGDASIFRTFESDRVRILINARFLLKDRLEGIGLYTHEIVSRLVRDHPEDEFVLCFDRPYDDRFIYGPNVTPVVARPAARHPLLFLWWFQVVIPRLYRRLGADLFFSPDGFATYRSRVDRQVVVVHDLAYLHFPDQVGWAMRRYYQTQMPRVMLHADRLIAVSQATAADMEAHFPQAAGKCRVVYNGTRQWPIPAEGAARPAQDPGRKYFLHLGAIHPRKNVGRLIQAFDRFRAQTKSEDVDLVIAGRKAWQTREVEEALASSPYQDDIKFLGYVDDWQLRQLMQNCLALVYVSLLEGFGLPIVEAMSLGCPVITSDRSSMAEIGGEAAHLVNPEEVQDITDGMTALYTDENYAQALASKGPTRAKMFDWDLAARQTYDVMKELW